jgi:hypothetical protein
MLRFGVLPLRQHIARVVGDGTARGQGKSAL